MKVSYQVVGAGGYTLLLDTSAGANLILEWEPDFKAVVMDENSFLSAAKIRRAQGNISCSLPLVWDQQYASFALCQHSLIDIGALMNQLIHIKVEVDTETQYYPNASVVRYKGKLNGVSALHKVDLETDLVQSSPP